MDDPKTSLIERRRIEALMAVPLIEGYIQNLGYAPALEVAMRSIQDLAREGGRQTATELKTNTIGDLALVMRSWAEGGVLEERVLEQTDSRYHFDVTRCRYAEMYAAEGIQRFGYCLSCCRDEPFIAGFNPRIEFKRTQTIMEGAEYCDFRLTLI